MDQPSFFVIPRDVLLRNLSFLLLFAKKTGENRKRKRILVIENVCRGWQICRAYSILE